LVRQILVIGIRLVLLLTLLGGGAALAAPTLAPT
jgi:hypothetical protein